MHTKGWSVKEYTVELCIYIVYKIDICYNNFISLVRGISVEKVYTYDGAIFINKR